MQHKFFHRGQKFKDVTVKIRSAGKIIGYGVIIDKDGWVLTNHHILKDVENVTIQLQDKDDTIYPAEIVGKNGEIGVCLLKFRTYKPSVSIVFGDDRKLKPGEWVFSGGSRLGIIQAGIVSALRRHVPRSRKIPTLGLFGLLGSPNKSPIRGYPEVIQHDSDIEKGEFGTPLINHKGELVGINTGHFYRGTTFAVPVSLIKKALPALKKGLRISIPRKYIAPPRKMKKWEKVFDYFLEKPKKRPPLEKVLKDLFQTDSKTKKTKSGFLGVQIQPHWRGVEIVQVLKGYAAHRHGLKKGDIILEINKQKAHSVVSLLEILKHIPPKTKVKVTILRKENQKFVKRQFLITLDQRP